MMMDDKVVDNQRKKKKKEELALLNRYRSVESFLFFSFFFLFLFICCTGNTGWPVRVDWTLSNRFFVFLFLFCLVFQWECVCVFPLLYNKRKETSQKGSRKCFCCFFFQMSVCFHCPIQFFLSLSKTKIKTIGHRLFAACVCNRTAPSSCARWERGLPP